jgi:hypothetical protein
MFDRVGEIFSLVLGALALGYLVSKSTGGGASFTRSSMYSTPTTPTSRRRSKTWSRVASFSPTPGRRWLDSGGGGLLCEGWRGYARRHRRSGLRAGG